MHFSVLLTLISLAQCQWTLFDINRDQYQTVKRDVCVVGGGSSGTYAAVRLTDMNQSVAVVERNDYLGGHAFTYFDPKTKVGLDIGVVILQPFKVTRDFFGRFNVPLLNTVTNKGNTPGKPANASLPSLFYQTVPENVDFRSGDEVEVSMADLEAFGRFATELEKYPYILEGYELPDPVPEDLLLPFGAFVEKHNLSNIVNLYYAYVQGMGDLLNILTIYVVKYFNLQDIENLKNGWLTAAKGIGEVFTKAGQYIGDDNLFLESSVIAQRGQELLISGAAAGSGLTLLQCDKILLTIPPTISNLAGWDIQADQKSVFSQFSMSNGYWTGLVTNVGLNESVSFTNAAENKAYSLPVLPALYGFSAKGTIPDVWGTYFGSPNPTLTDDQVKAAIVAEIQLLQSANGVPVTQPEFLTFHSHVPFQLQVTPEAIRDGFYRNLTALQGKHNTWYTGAAFHTHDSAFLWRFTDEVVLPMLMA